MYWNLIADFLKVPTFLLQGMLRKKLSLRWEGSLPPLALRFKFLRDTDIQFNHKSKLRVLNFEALKLIQQRTSYFKFQIIRKNKTSDMHLIKQSWIHFYPHEVTQIRIVNSQNIDIVSKLHHGGPYRGASMKHLRQQINTLCFRARKRGLIIEEVQILHTHPSLEVMISNEEDPHQESSFIFNGLSKGDIKLGETLAPFIHYPLRIKAITTAANYSMLF